MILVMAGTSDGRAIATKLQEQGLPVCVSVTTDHGRTLAASEGLSVMTGSLDGEGIYQLLCQEHIQLLVDGTHPYAAGASTNGQWAAEKAGIPYYRYERPQTAVEASDVRWFESLETLAATLDQIPKPTLLTLGSNHLECFSTLSCKDQLYIRVLPTVPVMEKCRQLGYRADRILAMQGPFSEPFNQALIDLWGIQRMVTKESASAGGFPEKLAAAKAAGIELWVLGRPEIHYENLFNQIDDLVKAVCQKYRTYKTD